MRQTRKGRKTRKEAKHAARRGRGRPAEVTSFQLAPFSTSFGYSNAYTGN